MSATMNRSGQMVKEGFPGKGLQATCPQLNAPAETAAAGLKGDRYTFDGVPRLYQLLASNGRRTNFV